MLTLLREYIRFPDDDPLRVETCWSDVWCQYNGDLIIHERICRYLFDTVILIHGYEQDKVFCSDCNSFEPNRQPQCTLYRVQRPSVVRGIFEHSLLTVKKIRNLCATGRLNTKLKLK